MLRVSVVHAVVGLMFVLIARAIVIVLSLSFRSQFSVLGGLLFTLSVGDNKLRWLLPNITVILHQIIFENHSTNNWPNHCLSGFQSVLGSLSR